MDCSTPSLLSFTVSQRAHFRFMFHWSVVCPNPISLSSMVPFFSASVSASGIFFIGSNIFSDQAPVFGVTASTWSFQ